jgi:hypothetical protein
LAHAMSSRQLTAPKTSQSAGRTVAKASSVVLTKYALNRMGAGYSPSAVRAAVSVRSSAFAWFGVTLGFSRAAAYSP